MVVSDVYRPFCALRSGDIEFRWSVGFYFNKKRYIIAWFEHFDDAFEFLVSCRKANPTRFYDVLQSFY